MPRKDADARRAYMRDYMRVYNKRRNGLRNTPKEKVRLKGIQERRKELGLCRVCGSPEVNNESKCANCKRVARARLQRVKRATLDIYGGYCACCGETELAFLTIDHINGGGCKHRKELGFGSLYDWLKRNHYPQGFQVLCMNCNLGKYLCGVCPHQKAISEYLSN